MRIIGGKYKGRSIAVHRSFHSRPTTDFAREGIFNIMSNHFDFQEVHFLDLYCGTGSIGIEACSRGCAKAELVDINRQAIHHLNRIIREFDLKGARAVCMESLEFLKICRDRYHLVFADPPYDYRLLPELPTRVLKSNVLLQDGWFILEHSSKYRFSENTQLIDERQYGGVHFSIFRGN
ncbi:MAG: RsmD family RNA methyltransferase [Bacteroidales bacterium]|nr:RsmD family RNA methyltransferase [Bacteroidales bacterium]